MTRASEGEGRVSDLHALAARWEKKARSGWGADFPLAAGAVLICVDELRAALASSRDGWRDISSAPKDGSEFVAFRRFDEFHESLWFVHWSPSSLPAEAGRGMWFDDRGNQRMPTHWMPLPPAPSSIEGDEK